jgi:hypothetical protein
MDASFKASRAELNTLIEKSCVRLDQMVSDFAAESTNAMQKATEAIYRQTASITPYAHAGTTQTVYDADVPLSLVQPSTPKPDHNLGAYPSSHPHSFLGNSSRIDENVVSDLSSSSAPARWQPSRSSWDSIPEYRMAPKTTKKGNRRRRKSSTTKASVSKFTSRMTATKTGTRHSVAQCKKTTKIRGYEQELREAFRTAYRTEKDEASFRGETIDSRFKKAAKRRAWLKGYALLESEMTQNSWQEERAAEQSEATARQARYGACDPNSRRQSHRPSSATRSKRQQYSSPPNTLDW